MEPLDDEAVNCLKFWQNHWAYGGSFSDVVKEYERILRGD